MTRMLSCWSIWPVWNIHSIVLKGTFDIAHFCPSSFVPKCHTVLLTVSWSLTQVYLILAFASSSSWAITFRPIYFQKSPLNISFPKKVFLLKSSSLDYSFRVEDNQFLSVKFHGWIHRNTLLHFRWLPCIEYLTCVGYGQIHCRITISIYSAS